MKRNPNRKHYIALIFLLMAFALSAVSIFAVTDDAEKIQNPEASIGDVEYETITEALGNVKDGETISLLRDISCDASIKIFDEYVSADSFTIDLNEHILYIDAKHLFYIGEGKDVIFTDTCYIRATNSDIEKFTMLSVEKGAKLTLDSANFCVRELSAKNIEEEYTLLNFLDDNVLVHNYGTFIAKNSEISLKNCSENAGYSGSIALVKNEANASLENCNLQIETDDIQLYSASCFVNAVASAKAYIDNTNFYCVTKRVVEKLENDQFFGVLNCEGAELKLGNMTVQRKGFTKTTTEEDDEEAINNKGTVFIGLYNEKNGRIVQEDDNKKVSIICESYGAPVIIKMGFFNLGYASFANFELKFIDDKNQKNGVYSMGLVLDGKESVFDIRKDCTIYTKENNLLTMSIQVVNEANLVLDDKYTIIYIPLADKIQSTCLATRELFAGFFGEEVPPEEIGHITVNGGYYYYKNSYDDSHFCSLNHPDEVDINGGFYSNPLDSRLVKNNCSFYKMNFPKRIRSDEEGELKLEYSLTTNDAYNPRTGENGLVRDLVKSAAAGDCIQLSCDSRVYGNYAYKTDSPIVIEKDITFDTNGYDYSCSSDAFFKVNGGKTLTISTDSEIRGRIINSNGVIATGAGKIVTGANDFYYNKNKGFIDTGTSALVKKGGTYSTDVTDYCNNGLYCFKGENDRYQLALGPYFSRQNVSLNGNTAINFYGKLRGNIDSNLDKVAYRITRVNPENSEIESTIIPFTDSSISSAEANDGNMEYGITVSDIPAKQIGDKIKAEIVSIDQEANVKQTYATKEYSVRLYADSMLAKDTSSDKLKKVLISLLKYGRYAQQKFEYNTTNLADKGLNNGLVNSYQTAFDEVTSANAHVEHGDVIGTGISGAATSLILGSEVTIRFHLPLSSDADTRYADKIITYKKGDVKKIFDDGISADAGEIEMGPNGEYYYTVEINGIRMQNINQVYSLQIADTSGDAFGIVKYSVCDYISNVLDHKPLESMTEQEYINLKNLVKALFVLGQDTAAYNIK